MESMRSMGPRDERFENFVITILKLNKLIGRIKLLEMEGYDLRAVHVMCIYYIERREDGLTASELSKLTLEDKAAISRALGTLRERGYINYDTKKYNSKATLTDEGRRLADYIEERAESYVNAGGGELTDAERATLYGALNSISARLEAYYDGMIAKRDAEK